MFDFFSRPDSRTPFSGDVYLVRYALDSMVPKNHEDRRSNNVHFTIGNTSFFAILRYRFSGTPCWWTSRFTRTNGNNNVKTVWRRSRRNFCASIWGKRWVEFGRSSITTPLLQFYKFLPEKGLVSEEIVAEVTFLGFSWGILTLINFCKFSTLSVQNLPNCACFLPYV